MLKRGVEKGSSLPNKQIFFNFKLLIDYQEYFFSFSTVLPGKYNVLLFNGRNQMSASALRQNIENKVKNYRQQI